ncbi:MAG: PQQ-binding-like beta-propeller repeat protein [Bacteroidales bacterium]|nr:PQQ-binding-like beta-propeller repeat protein [Bacteroidales bacterium]
MNQFLKNIFTIIFVAVFIISCKKDEPEIHEDPIVYDETGMLGLADSPWPCDGHDSRRTSQSPYNGPSSVSASMIYDSSPGFHISDATSPAIDASGNLYCPAWTRVLKFSSSHNFEWENETGLYLTNIQPIAKDGIIYIGGFDQYGVQNYTEGLIIAIDQSNKTKWEFEMPDDKEGGIFGALAIGSNGTIYAVDKSGFLFAINKLGQKLWSFKLDRLRSYSSPAIAPDGTIFVVDYDDNLYAVKPNGELLWKYPAGKDINYDPIVAIDGTVYIGSENSLLAVSLTGEKQWEYSLPDAATNRPSLANDGTIFIACNDKNLYAINSDGSLKWTYNAGGFITSPSTIDVAGNIYLGAVSDSSKLISVSSQGELIWEYPLGLGYGQPVIDADGTLYVGTSEGKIYALTENK